MMSDRDELIKRVEAATGPDMIVDAMLYAMFDLPDPLSWPDRTWTIDGDFYAKTEGYHWPERHLLRSNDGELRNPDRGDCPAYTDSIDDALALVESRGWAVHTIRHNKTQWNVVIHRADNTEISGEGAGPTLSLALVGTLLRAEDA